MKEPKTELGRELRKLRLKGTIKYSQVQLATLVGITASYISQLETGDRKNPKPEVIRELSRHLGVKANHLFRTLGMAEMDLAKTLAGKRAQVHLKMPDLPEKQLEEIANYLTYLDFKASVLE